MKILIDVYPLINAEKLFDRNYKRIKPLGFDEETVPILKKMFDFSRMIDVFLCEHLSIDALIDNAFDDVPIPSPLLVEIDKVESSIISMCDILEDLIKNINTSDIVFPTAFHRDLNKVQTILFKLKNTKK